MTRLLPVFTLGLGLLAGCAAEDSPLACTEGELRACVCADGRDGSQRCGANSTLEACTCSGSAIADATSADMSADATTQAADTASTTATDMAVADTGGGTDTATAADTGAPDVPTGPACAEGEADPFVACFDEAGCGELEPQDQFACAQESCSAPFVEMGTDCQNCIVQGNQSGASANDVIIQCEGGTP